MFLSEKRKQPFLSEYLNCAVKNNSVSHAYLFETNNFAESLIFVKEFAKFLLCPNNGCGECNICHLIESNQYRDYYVIDATSSNIKKSQILDLQTEFKNKALLNRRVYVITDASKLNNSSANTLLKFLEEPENDIVALLLCNNRYQIIDTIRSRCQVFPLYYSANDYNYDDDSLSFLEDVTINRERFYIDRFSEKYSFLDDKNLLEVKCYKILELLQLLVNLKCGLISNFNSLEKLSTKLEINVIIKIALITDDFLSTLKYNINLKLAVDKYLLDIIEVISCIK